MAFSTEQVLNMLDSSDESDIYEDPCFLLPHDSESEADEPHLPTTSTSISATQTGTTESCDSSDEENAASSGKIQFFSNNTQVFTT